MLGQPSWLALSCPWEGSILSKKEARPQPNATRSKRATIDEVASLAGVSIKTVSRVFNSEPNVRAQTRDRVLEAASQLNYRPNLSARRLASNRSFVIGLLYDNPQSEYVTGIQEGTLEVCRREGYHLLIHPCRVDDPKILDDTLGMYRQAMVDGFILTQPVSESTELMEALINEGVRFVRIAQKPYDYAPCISVNDVQAAMKMTEHLLSSGHRRIGFIKGHPQHGSSHDRYKGYQAALSAYGIPEDTALVEQGLFNFESGYSCARRLLSLTSPPTAIFASNDHMAMGVLTAAHEKKLEIPKQLSVCGFDDASIARYAWPSLTTLRQPIKQTARLAAEVLLSCIKNKDSKGANHELHSELLVRESTGHAPS